MQNADLSRPLVRIASELETHKVRSRYRPQITRCHGVFSDPPLSRTHTYKLWSAKDIFELVPRFDLVGNAKVD